MTKIYYKILGIGKNACVDAVKKAYRKLALMFHPDKNKSSGAEEKSKEVLEAYAVLSDEEGRKVYDCTFKEPSFASEKHCDGETVNHKDVQSTSGSTEKSGQQEVPDVEHDVYVTLSETFYGCNKKVKIIQTVMSQNSRTPKCEVKIFTIDIKPGCKAGTKIAFPREGDETPGTLGTTLPENIVFIISDQPHPLFERLGADVHHTSVIALKEFSRGKPQTRSEMKTNADYELRVPSLADDYEAVGLTRTDVAAGGTVKRIKGKELPHHDNPKTRGTSSSQVKSSPPERFDSCILPEQ